jgi:hypothetical protein
MLIISAACPGPKSARAVSIACNNTKLCGDGNFIKSVMQEMTPTLTMLYCDPITKVATVTHPWSNLADKSADNN